MTVASRFWLIVAVGAFLSVVFLVQLYPLEAATPQLLLSWSPKESYIPDSYPGKALPSPLTPIQARVALIDGGRTIDLSSYLIRWSLDNYVTEQGQGLTFFEIKPSLRSNQEARRLGVEVVGYPGGSLSKTLNVPIVFPKITLRGESSGGSLFPGRNKITAQPYFFGITRRSGLDYSWRVDGIYRGQDAGGVLNLTVAEGARSGSRVEVQVSAKSISNDFDQASVKQSFIVR